MLVALELGEPEAAAVVERLRGARLYASDLAEAAVRSRFLVD